jgi:N-ethylmaleimide reductase
MQEVSRRIFMRNFLGSLPVFALGQAGATSKTASEPALFDPAALRDLKLANRVLMAPMTRGRAGTERTANSLMTEYYAQRATAGLIVTEGTAISGQGYGWVGSPGIYTEAQAAGWQSVTHAVHQRGGRIFLQLWHTGRVSHPDFLDGQTPVGPSAVIAAGETHTPYGKKPYVMPRAMTKQEIAVTVRDYAQAAKHARDAGFDGVEIHAANGYLIDQFIRDGSNLRADEYGGSVQNRLRFLLEVTEAVARTWSADRVGVRLSPSSDYNSMRDSAPTQTFTRAAKELNRFGLSYLHVVEYLSQDPLPTPQERVAPQMRAAFGGPFILNGGYDARTGAAALKAGEADLLAYGRLFLANPDLVERFRTGAALNEPDTHTFYSSGSKGYTDYPTLPSLSGG